MLWQQPCLLCTASCWWWWVSLSPWPRSSPPTCHPHFTRRVLYIPLSPLFRQHSKSAWHFARRPDWSNLHASTPPSLRHLQHGPRKYAKLVPGDVLSPADFFSNRGARVKKANKGRFSLFFTWQGFYLYLYFGSMLFLLCMYATVLRPKPSAAAKKSKSKYTFFYSAQSWWNLLLFAIAAGAGRTRARRAPRPIKSRINALSTAFSARAY